MAGCEKKIQFLFIFYLMFRTYTNTPSFQALALMSLPTHVPASLSELHSLSSDILHLASDPSVDASWYTKRLSLSAVYASAEVVMTQDSSPNFVATEEFVQRRLEDSKDLGQKAADIKGFLGYMATTAVGLGRSSGLKI
jgi:ubiquinone biosynthesis protein COQ9